MAVFEYRGLLVASGKTVHDVRDAVVQALSDFTGSRSAGDDVTLVVSSVP